MYMKVYGFNTLLYCELLVPLSLIYKKQAEQVSIAVTI
jgi:hypothetical protein